MKIIFLDIDGVLNTTKTFIDNYYFYKSTGIRRVEIDEFRVKYLKEIVDKTDSKIVLSSSWRFFGKMIDNTYVPSNDKMKCLIDIFNNYGLSIYDITPRDSKGIRQNEINMWLGSNNVDSFIVIDDDSYDLVDFIDRELIKTSNTKDDEMIMNMDSCTGLCGYHVEEAVCKLNKKYQYNKKM